MSIRSQLRALYESNIAGAEQFGAWWAVDDFKGRMRHLDEHPIGPLTKRMREDVRYFGNLILQPEEER